MMATTMHTPADASRCTGYCPHHVTTQDFNDSSAYGEDACTTLIVPGGWAECCSRESQKCCTRARSKLGSGHAPITGVQQDRSSSLLLFSCTCTHTPGLTSAHSSLPRIQLMVIVVQKNPNRRMSIPATSQSFPSSQTIPPGNLSLLLLTILVLFIGAVAIRLRRFRTNWWAVQRRRQGRR